MRKFWFVYLGQALIVFPGGLGTLDEMMEILTLLQTKKITRKVPVLLYSEEFWKKVINLDYLAEMGMISHKDHSLFTYVNEPREAFELLRDKLTLIHGL
jgi:predicted Rossmann-fold nucleotide-binding protein